MRRLWPYLALLLAGGAGLIWWQLAPRDDPAWQGYADADFLRIGAVLEGRLTSLAVARGATVAAGDVLFTQDDVPDRAAFDQARAAVEQARAQLANLQAGGKETEIAAAAADVADAQARLARARADLARTAALVPGGAATRRDLDAAREAVDTAVARLDAARARHAQANAPAGRRMEIDAAARALEQAQAAAQSAQWRLAQRRVLAPASARVTDVLRRPGEIAPAGAPVVELLPPENLLVRFFVPLRARPALQPGQELLAECDGCGGPISVRITYIAPQAEYTPPVIYSNESAAKLVFMLEAKPAGADAQKLHPGQPVRVRTLPQ